MNILVTGCYGFIGHYVTLRLLEFGHDVTGTDRLRNPVSDKSARIGSLIGKRFKFLEADISNAFSMRQIIGSRKFDVVVHLSGQFAVKHTPESVKRYVKANLQGFINVMEAAREYKVPRVLFASSIAARTRGKPTSLYGATKHFNEEAGHVYSRFGIEVVGLRYAAVYGPLMRPDAGIYRVLLTLKRHGAMPWMTGFKSKHEMVEISDAAECTVRLSTATLKDRYNLFLIAGNDAKADFGDVVKEAAPLLNVPAVYPDGYEITPRGTMPEISDMIETIGWCPEISLRQGLTNTVDWMGQ